jgi:hypothetical protein
MTLQLELFTAMHLCGRCRRLLPLSAFHQRSDRPGKPQSYCKPCRSAYHREWYARSYARHRANVAELKRRYRQENKQLLAAAKAVPCADCGGRFPTRAMDFDHVRGVKRGNVAQMVKDAASPVAVRAEIAKCDVVCANCDRIRTEQREVAARPEGFEPPTNSG